MTLAFGVMLKTNSLTQCQKIRARFKYFQVKSHIQTVCETHDLNMDFCSLTMLQTTMFRGSFARIYGPVNHEILSNHLKGVQWLSGRVLVSRPMGCTFEPHRRHCIVSLSKNINHSLVLVQPRKTCLFITERLLMGHKDSNQTKIFSS